MELPFIQVPTLFGVIQPFGVLVAIGVLFGSHFGLRYAERLGLLIDEVRDTFFWALVVGFIGAHVFDALAYQWDTVKSDPLYLFKVWASISSFGGLASGTLGAMYFLKVRSGRPLKNAKEQRYRERLVDNLSLQYPARDHVLEFIDVVAFSLCGGWIFGRLGCSTVHDHLGAVSETIGVRIPAAADLIATNQHFARYAGQLHHDLGLYEFLYTIPLFISMYVLSLKPRRPGFMVAWFITIYSTPRFFLDYFRFESTDPRYAGLTPGQWFSMLGVALGVAMFVYVFTKGRPAPDSLWEVGAQERPLPAASDKKSAKGGGKTPKKKS